MELLDELLEKIDSKESFLNFIEALKDNKIDEDKKEKIEPSGLYSDGKNGWVNDTISDFLDSVHAFGSGTDDLKLEWQSIATLFYSGKFYE